MELGRPRVVRDGRLPLSQPAHWATLERVDQRERSRRVNAALEVLRRRRVDRERVAATDRAGGRRIRVVRLDRSGRHPGP